MHVTYNRLDSNKDGKVTLTKFKDVMQKEIWKFEKENSATPGAITNGKGMSENGVDEMQPFITEAIQTHGLPFPDALGIKVRNAASDYTGSESFGTNDYIGKLFQKMGGRLPNNLQGDDDVSLTKAQIQAYVAQRNPYVNFKYAKPNFWLSMIGD